MSDEARCPKCNGLVDVGIPARQVVACHGGPLGRAIHRVPSWPRDRRTRGTARESGPSGARSAPSSNSMRMDRWSETKLPNKPLQPTSGGERRENAVAWE